MLPYVSIDIETTGLDSERCQVLEFGAIFDPDGLKPIDDLPWIHFYLGWSIIIGEPFAIAMNADIIKAIANKHPDTINPEELGPRLTAWLQGIGVDVSQAVTAAGKNFASFDLQFLKKFPGIQHPNGVRFQHRFIDPTMLYWLPDVDTKLPDTKTCKERADVPGKVAHNALADALDVIKLVRRGAQLKRAHIYEPPLEDFEPPTEPYAPPKLYTEEVTT